MREVMETMTPEAKLQRANERIAELRGQVVALRRSLESYAHPCTGEGTVVGSEELEELGIDTRMKVKHYVFDGGRRAREALTSDFGKPEAEVIVAAEAIVQMWDEGRGQNETVEHYEYTLIQAVKRMNAANSEDRR